MTDTSANALELHNLSVAYRVGGRNRAVLRDLSLTIHPGEAYGLVGESGCGKSTVALSVVRYLPRNGVITAGGISLAWAERHEARQRSFATDARRKRLDGLSGSRQGAEPLDPHWPAVDGDF